MKNSLKLLFALCLLNIVGIAQKVETKDVPLQVQKMFTAKFPKATDVKWEIENKKDFEANFKIGNVEQSATFDKSGEWLETEIEISISQLPAAVSQSVKKEFPDYKFKEASSIDSKINGKCYEVEISKGKDKLDVLVSPDGKIISKNKSVD
jgi:hypothetical protein